MNRDNRADLLSFDCLMILALLQRSKQISKSDLSKAVGLSPEDLEERLRLMESLGAIRRTKNRYRIRSIGKKIVRAFELYKFEPGLPRKSYDASLADSRKTRRLNTNQFYFPKKIEI